MSDSPALRNSPVSPSRLSWLVSTISIERALIVMLAMSLAVVVLGAFRRPVNGDEFIFLSNIHRAVNGEQLGLLQTAYVHLFQWLPAVGKNEIAQVTFGRMIFGGLWAGSLMLLYRLGRRLLDPIGALAGVVLFALFTNSVINAAGFRIDGLLLPILLAVALLLLNPTTFRVAAAGALSGLALALTIKAVLWAPAFIGVLAVGLWDSQHRLRPVLAGALAGAASFAGILLVHAWLISTDTAPMPGIPVDHLATVGTYMFFEGFLPQRRALIAAAQVNPATWILLVVGFGLALAGLREPQSRRKSLNLLFLALPILSVTFYANAFAYAYLVLMPTACLLAGKAFSRFMGTADGLKGVAALICLGAAAVSLAIIVWAYRVDGQQEQRQFLSTVHRLFENPVPYIDGGGMVASFPRQPLFISRFVLELYRNAGVPVVTNYIRDSKPPLLIVNSPALQVWNTDELESLDPSHRLLLQDEETIRATYAHYWDKIYLAGRQWSDLAAGDSRLFEIVIPGDHTLIARQSVVVDGQTYAPGASVTLEAGPHRLRTTAAEPDLRILWGRDVKLPSKEDVKLPSKE